MRVYSSLATREIAMLRPSGDHAAVSREGQVMRQTKRLLSSNRFDVEIVPAAIVLSVPREGDLAAIGRERR